MAAREPTDLRSAAVAAGPDDAAVSEPLLLRVEEAASLLRIGRSTLYELIARGEIPSMKIGAARRIPLAPLRAWTAERTRRGR